MLLELVHNFLGYVNLEYNINNVNNVIWAKINLLEAVLYLFCNLEKIKIIAGAFREMLPFIYYETCSEYDWRRIPTSSGLPVYKAATTRSSRLTSKLSLKFRSFSIVNNNKNKCYPKLWSIYKSLVGNAKKEQTFLSSKKTTKIFQTSRELTWNGPK